MTQVKKQPEKASLIKKVFLITGVLLIAAILVFLPFAKGIIRDQVRKAISKSVRGSFDFSDFSIGTTGLTIENAAIFSRKGEKWIAVKNIRAKYNLLKLLDFSAYEKALTSIEIDEPYVVLFLNEKGIVNFDGLFIPGPEKPGAAPSRELEFDCPVTLTKGSFHYSDNRKKHKINASTKDVNGNLHFYSVKKLTVDLHATTEEENAVLDITGKIVPETFGIYLNFKGRGLSASKWGDYIAGASEHRLSGGKISVDMNLASKNIYSSVDPLEAIDITGKAFIDRCSFETPLLKHLIRNIEGKVRLTKDTITIDKLSATYQNVKMSLAGGLAGLTKPKLKVFLTAKAVPLSLILKEGYKEADELEAKGKISINAGVSGIYDTPEVKAQVKSKYISIAGEEFRDVEAGFSYFRNTINFEIKNALFSGGSIDGMGWINIENTQTGMIELHGRNTDAGRLVRKFLPNQHIAAISDFDVRIIGTPDSPLVLGDSSITGFSYQDKNIGNGRAGFLLDKETVLLNDITLNTDGGTVSSPGGYVDLQDKMLDFSLSARDFNIPAGWLPSGTPLTARGNAKARIVGGFEAPIITGEVDNGGIIYNGKQINNLSGSFVYWGNTFSLQNAQGNLAGSPFTASAWLNMDGKMSGEAVFDIKDARLSNLAVINPYFGSLKSMKSINLSGMITGEENRFGWGITGRGKMGNLAAFGSLRNDSGVGFSANIIGWNMDLNEWVAPEHYSTFKPGIGNFLIMAKGTPSSFRAYYLADLEAGKSMGLPVNKGRGLLKFSSGKIAFRDNHWEGFYSAPGRDRRIAIVDDDFNLTTYWGFDINPGRTMTPFARMYFLPYILQGAVFTRNGWQASMVKPVVFRKDALPGEEIVPVDGLPELWLSMRQLRKHTDGGYPHSISFNNLIGNERADRLPAFSAWIDGNLDTNKKTISMSIKSREMDAGHILKKLDLSQYGVSVKKIRDDLSLNNLEGTANVEGMITGYWDSPTWKGKAAIQDGILDYESFEFDADFSVNKKGLCINNFDYNESVGSYCGRGTIDFSKKMPIDLTIDVTGGKLENLLARSPIKDTKSRGTLWGKVFIKGNASEPLVSGNVSLKNATVANVPISDANADMQSTTNSITLKNLTAKVDGSDIKGEGSVKGSNIDFTFKSEKLNLSTFDYLNPDLPDLKGEASVLVKIGGTRTSPVADVQLTTGEFLIKTYPFKKAGGRIHWGNKTLSLEDFTLEGIDSYWKMDGSIYFPKGDIPLDWESWIADNKNAPAINIKSEVNNWKLSNYLDVTNSSYKNMMDGKIQGMFELSGTMSRPEFKLGLRLKDGRIAANHFNTFDSFITYRPGILDINRIEYIAPDSHALLTGQIDEDRNQFNITADAENLPVEMLHPFIPGTEMLRGKIQTITKITGKLETPELISDTRITNGSFGIVEFDEAGGNFKADSGVISFDDLKIRKDKKAISFAGKIPLEIKDGKFINPEDMEITTDINDNSLDTLSLVVPGITDTEGSFRGNLQLKGKFPSFYINGKTEIKNGRMKLSYMDNYIEGINSKINFLGKDIEVAPIKGKLGDGEFKIEGKAHISETETTIDNINLSLNGENMAVMIPGFVRGRIDTALSVTGSLMHPILGASTESIKENYVSISNATISIPDQTLKELAAMQPAETKPKSDKTPYLLSGVDWWEFDKHKDAVIKAKTEPTETVAATPAPKKQESFLPEVRDITVKIGSDVWLDFKGLFIKSDGNINISFHPEDGSDIDGKISFSRGTLQFPFLKNPFKVTKGEVLFTEDTPNGDLNPIITLEASTYTSGAEVFMDYRGTLDNLKDSFENNKSSIAGLNLYSYPAYSREEILELLVSNSIIGVPSITSNQNTGLHTPIESAAVNMLSNYLQGLVLTPITRSFGRAFSLSEIFFEMGVSGTWNLRMSKALDAKERFFLTFSQARGIQGQTTGIWGIEYKYRPGMRLRLESYEGAMIGSVQGQIQFNGMKEFFRELFNIVRTKKSSKAKQKKVSPQ